MLALSLTSLTSLEGQAHAQGACFMSHDCPDFLTFEAQISLRIAWTQLCRGSTFMTMQGSGDIAMYP